MTRPDTPVVVFLIGMRVNEPLKVHRWLPVFLAMPRMLRELAEHLPAWRRFDRLVRGSGDVGPQPRAHGGRGPVPGY